MHICNMHFYFWDLKMQVPFLFYDCYLICSRICIYIYYIKTFTVFLIFMTTDLCSRHGRICVHTHNKYCGYLSNNYFNVYYYSDFQIWYSDYSVFHYWPHKYKSGLFHCYWGSDFHAVTLENITNLIKANRGSTKKDLAVTVYLLKKTMQPVLLVATPLLWKLN